MLFNVTLYVSITAVGVGCKRWFQITEIQSFGRFDIQYFNSSLVNTFMYTCLDFYVARTDKYENSSAMVSEYSLKCCRPVREPRRDKDNVESRQSW